MTMVIPEGPTLMSDAGDAGDAATITVKTASITAAHERRDIMIIARLHAVAQSASQRCRADGSYRPFASPKNGSALRETSDTSEPCANAKYWSRARRLLRADLNCDT
jgi:hypothetical protein